MGGGDGGKEGGWGRERERMKKTRKRGNLKGRNKEMERERSRVFRGQLESLQNPLLKPTIKFQPKLRSQYED